MRDFEDLRNQLALLYKLKSLSSIDSLYGYIKKKYSGTHPVIIREYCSWIILKYCWEVSCGWTSGLLKKDITNLFFSELSLLVGDITKEEVKEYLISIEYIENDYS